MKRMLVASLVLGLCAVVAHAGLVITVTKVGSALTVQGDQGSAVVDVYDITISSPNANTFETTVDMTIGAATGKGSDPFQAAYTTKTKVGGKWTYPINLTPSEDSDSYWDPCDGSNIYQADSRFLPSAADANDPCGGIENWLAIQAPTETNDKSIDPNRAIADDIVLGKGGLSTISAIPVPMQSPSLQLAAVRVGVVQGTQVWCLDQCAWYDGVADQSDNVTFMIPEPATLSMLCLGALALIRRRRS
ncbi:MAG: PEP-CTERM sorting domain-containing protein [Phycisphaerae bacterium]